MDDEAGKITLDDVDPSQISIAQRRAIFLGVALPPSTKAPSSNNKDSSSNGGPLSGKEKPVSKSFTVRYEPSDARSSSQSNYPEPFMGKSCSQSDLLETNCHVTTVKLHA